MAADIFSEDLARELVDMYVRKAQSLSSTQEILDSGVVPRLKGYVVRPGKVSDSIFGGKGSFFDKLQGKVVEFDNPLLSTRDGVPLRLMVRTARISTHDINRGDIPFKDQILAMNHYFMHELLRPALGSSQFAPVGLGPTSVVIAAENLKPVMFENVLRAYMAKSTTSTSLYVHYMSGKREFCGHKLPEGLFANGPLPYVMDTPSTKSDEHDESVAPFELYRRGICTPAEYRQVRNASIFAFGVVSHFLSQRGIIAVDTKTEHGVNHLGKIVAQDELWTMDSSRFWLRSDYDSQLEKLRAGEISELAPRSFSKEFARGFSEGEKGYSDDQRREIAVRYFQGIQHLLGERFSPDMRPRDERVVSGLENVVKALL
jgi:phosphoribosylaminoimidazole-succinocarboxamide synthase